MNELPISLSGLEKEDVFSVATALLYTLKDTPEYSVVSELFYILDYDNFIKLIRYFGGLEIRIPSSAEISELLKVLLLYQYRNVEELPWKEALSKADITEDESCLYRAKLIALSKILKSHNIGKRSYD